MGGSVISDESDFSWPSDKVQTIVLVGRTGNGKSATGNSILRSKVFRSTSSWFSVTRTSELKTLLMEDGRKLNVIDTPGLLDISVDSESIAKEIMKCVDMAIDGIHAFLFVLSVEPRFSREEEYAFKCLFELFGSKISDHMIVVFTGGDKIGSLDDFLHGCPEDLKNILKMCGNRRVLFDNRTEDELKKSKQVMERLYLVNELVDKTSGEPYTNELFIKFLLSEEIAASNKLKETTDALQIQLSEEIAASRNKLKETTDALEMQLSEERAARRNTENEVHKLVEKLEELRKQAGSGKCAIL